MNIGFAPEKIASEAELDPMVEFRSGVELLKNEYPQKALIRLQRAFDLDKHNAFYTSFLGLATARATQQWDQACQLCEMAVQLNPKEMQFYLNLSEVYALAGRREMALDKLDFAMGLFGEDPRLRQARSQVEKRRRPVVPFFERGHILNRNLGKMRHRVLGELDK